MDRPHDRCLPKLNADVDTLKRELEQVYQTVKSTDGKRREQTASASGVGMVIKGK